MSCINHNELVDYLLNNINNTIFFVGAGVSIAQPSVLPTFNELSKAILQSFDYNLSREDINYDELSNKIRPEVLFQILDEEVGPNILTALDFMIRSKPNYNHLFLSEMIKRGCCVFTTNYDDLIEKACISNNVNFRTCFTDSNYEQILQECISGKFPKSVIFKLHGYIDSKKTNNERYASILINLRRLYRTSFKDSFRGRVLEYYLKNFDFWFMGYSCRDDFTIYPILETPSSKTITWFQWDNNSLLYSVNKSKELRGEIEDEINKPFDKRRQDIININNILLRSNFRKIIGDFNQFSEYYIKHHTSLNITTEKRGKDWWKDMISSNKYIKQVKSDESAIIISKLYAYIEKYNKAIKILDSIKTRLVPSSLSKVTLLYSDILYRTEIKEESKKAIDELKKFVRNDYKISKNHLIHAYINLANYLRRSKYYDEAVIYLQKARKLLDPKIFRKKEEYNSVFSEYLYVYGLTLFGLAQNANNINEVITYLKEAEDVCKMSLNIRKNYDVSTSAMSYNALGLLLTEYGKYYYIDEIKGLIDKKLHESEKYLKEGLKLAQSVGDYRVCQQIIRNLLLLYKYLITYKLKRINNKEIDNLYTQWIDYASKFELILVDRLFALRLAVGEVYIANNNLDRALEVFNILYNETKNENQWHERARVLHKILCIYCKQRRIDKIIAYVDELVLHYKMVLNDNNKLNELKRVKIKLENAETFLYDSLNYIKYISDVNNDKDKIDFLMKEINNVIKVFHEIKKGER